jgi:hypothetical protein
MRNKITKALLLIIIFAGANAFAQGAKQAPLPKLKFRQGDTYSVKSVEKLVITMQFSQVDSALVEPSTRFTTYYFTERIDTVYSDGSADFATSLDSFKTKIIVGEVKDQNEYFRFDSQNDYDIKNRLKDIRALPRAQFLGQTLKYRVATDGMIMQFYNLSNFQQLAVARAFDNDIMQAMYSLSDSLRLGQLLEHGFGTLAAGSNPSVTTPYTMTEIHVDRNLTVKYDGKEHIGFQGKFSNEPEKVAYLEGINFLMDLTKFKGGLRGECIYKNGYIASGTTTDSASMVLIVPGDQIKNVVSRTFTVEREPLKVLRGATIHYKEIETHRAEYKEKEEKDDPNTLHVKVDMNTGEVIGGNDPKDTVKTDHH